MNIIHPLSIKGIEIPSNVFFAPINPGFSANGVIYDKYIDFFSQHAGNGIGICYVGNVALQKEWSSNVNTAVMSLTPQSRWTAVVKSIEETGSLSGIQLAWKPSQIIAQKSFITNNKAEQIEIFKEFYNSYEDYETTAELFVNNIKYACKTGFSVIQLHAAHGYALSLLLSKSISGCDNPMDTKGVKIIRKITDELDKSNIILDIRISLYEGINDGKSELEYKTQLMEELIRCGFDIISLSNGFYNIDKTMIYPPKNGKTVILTETQNFADKYTNTVWNVAGNMEVALKTEMLTPPNLTFSLGRQLLADPETVIKIKQHKYNDIQVCSECNLCHYYSYGFDGIQKCKLRKV